MGSEQSQHKDDDEGEDSDSGDLAKRLSPEIEGEVSTLQRYARNANEEETEIFQTNSQVFDFSELDVTKKDESGSTSVAAMENTEQYLRVRKKTLARYQDLADDVASVSSSTPSTGNSKKLQQAADQGMHSRSSRNSEAPSNRLKRAMTLQKVFFDKVDAEGSKSKNTFGSQDEIKRWIDRVNGSDVEIEVDEAEYKYEDMEQAIRHTLEEARSRLQNDSHHLISDRISQIRSIRTKLSLDQKKMIEKSRNDIRKVLKEIKTQKKAIKKLIKKKYKEGYRFDIPKKQKKDPKRRQKGRHKRKKASLNANDAEDQEHRYVEEINYLKSELVALKDSMKLLMLERRFPSCMNWKMRIDGKDGLYVGIRDMEVESLEADFEASSGIEPGIVNMKVSNLNAVVGALEFVITGQSALAKLLGGVLTPTINRLDLVVSGEWELTLKYNHKKSKWIQRKSKFRLNIKKEVSGITTIRLPTALVSLLSRTILPRLISTAIREALPKELNTFGYSEFKSSTSPFFAQPDNMLQVTGSLSVEGDMSPNVWRAPLYSPTRTSLAARRALQMNMDEAFALDFMLRGSVGLAAGFYNRSITLERLYKWRLKFASYPMDRLGSILDLVQKGTEEENESFKFPQGWLLQIFHRVEELSRKPVQFDINVSSLKTNVDLLEVSRNSMQIYLASLIEQKFEKSQSDKARLAFEREIEKVKLKTILSLKYLHEIAQVLNSEMELDCNVLVDGKIGLCLASLESIRGELLLGNINPRKIVLLSQQDDIPIWISSQNDAESGEYTIRIFGKDPSTNELDDKISKDQADITLRNANLALFPVNYTPGTVLVSADRLRGTLGFGILDDMLTSSLLGREASLINSNHSEQSQSLDLEHVRDEKVQELINLGNEIVLNLSNNDEINAETKDSMLSGRYNSLPDFITEEENELFVECRGLKTKLARGSTKYADDIPTLRLVTDFQTEEQETKEGKSGFRLTVRQDIAKVFDSFT